MTGVRQAPVRRTQGPSTAATASARSLLVAASLLASCPPALALGTLKVSELPWSVRADVHWGAHRNREAYRNAFEHEIIETLTMENCFKQIVVAGKADLRLDVQLNEVDTEEAFSTSSSLLPGQGEEHQLLSARATVNLDYWLEPDVKESAPILTNHVYREIVREPRGPGDPALDRAFQELVRDATRWVARQVCEQKEKLEKRIVKALAPPSAPPSVPEAPSPPSAP